jgi:hypothetical protein
MIRPLGRLLAAPLSLWRGRLWWLYAVVAFLVPLAFAALLVRTKPIATAFAYSLR